MRRVEKGQEEKSLARKVEKERRREDVAKRMEKFQERYPFYFQEDKIKFPIEDKLLFIYKELFEVTEPVRPKPTSHPLIPAPLLADLLQIENFFSTFSQELGVFG